MLHKTASSLARNLLRHQVIQEDSLDVYVYGFELLLSFLFSTSLIIISGLIMHKVLETIAFLVVFIFLRSYSGGYHASKYYVCTIVTLCVYASVMALSSFLSINFLAFAVLSVLGLISLTIWAPIENPNKEITPKRKRIYKGVSIVLFMFFVSLGILILPHFSKIGSTVFYTLCADIILMFSCILKKFRKGEIRDEVL